MTPELQLALTLLIGLAVAAVTKFLQAQPLWKALLWALVAAVGFWGLLTVFFQPDDSAPQEEAPETTAQSLARQLHGRVFVGPGETCDQDGVRLALERQELIAYPNGSPAVRYRLIDGSGQTLRLELGGRIILLELRDDQLLHIDQGHERWLSSCD